MNTTLHSRLRLPVLAVFLGGYSLLWAKNPELAGQVATALSSGYSHKGEYEIKELFRKNSPEDVFSFFSDARADGDLKMWAAEVLVEMEEIRGLPDSILVDMTAALKNPAPDPSEVRKIGAITAFYQLIGFHFPPASASKPTRKVLRSLEGLKKNIPDPITQMQFNHAIREYEQSHGNFILPKNRTRQVGRHLCRVILRDLASEKR